MQSLQDFWSTVFPRSPSFYGEKNFASILAGSYLCGLFGLLVGLLYQWFCSGACSCFESLSSRNQPDRGSHPSGRDGRYPACDRRADLSWGLAMPILKVGPSMQRFGSLPSSTVGYILSIILFLARSFYYLPQ